MSTDLETTVPEPKDIPKTPKGSYIHSFKKTFFGPKKVIHSVHQLFKTTKMPVLEDYTLLFDLVDSKDSSVSTAEIIISRDSFAKLQESELRVKHVHNQTLLLEKEIHRLKNSYLFEIKSSYEIDTIFEHFGIKNPNIHRYSELETKMTTSFSECLDCIRTQRSRYNTAIEKQSEREYILSELQYYTSKVVGLQKDAEKRKKEFKTPDSKSDIEKLERNIKKRDEFKKQYQGVHVELIELLDEFVRLACEELATLANGIWSQQLAFSERIVKALAFGSKASTHAAKPIAKQVQFGKPQIREIEKIETIVNNMDMKIEIDKQEILENSKDATT